MQVQRARRLQVVDDITEPFTLNVGALAVNEVRDSGIYKPDWLDSLVAVRQGRTVICGPLDSVTRSGQEPYLVLRVGDHSMALHPARTITVVPDGYRPTVSVSRILGDVS